MQSCWKFEKLDSSGECGRVRRGTDLQKTILETLRFQVLQVFSVKNQGDLARKAEEAPFSKGGVAGVGMFEQ